MIPERSFFFALALVLLVVFLGGVVAVFWVRSRRRGGMTLDGLLNRLAPLDGNSLALIAHDLHQPVSDGEDVSTYFDPAQIWDLIGGMDGLTRMEANCAVLIDLACLVQERYPEALLVAEELRLNAREIQWHLERLQGAARLGKLEPVFGDYAQRAVASYYGMTQRLLELYELADVTAHARVQGAL